MMKRTEYIAHLRNIPLADLQKEIRELEKSIQTEVMAIAFGKSKAVRTIRNHKKRLAQSLTIANQRLATPSSVGTEQEN